VADTRYFYQVGIPDNGSSEIMSFSTQAGNLVFAVSFAAHFRSFLINICPLPLGKYSPVQTSARFLIGSFYHVGVLWGIFKWSPLHNKGSEIFTSDRSHYPYVYISLLPFSFSILMSRNLVLSNFKEVSEDRIFYKIMKVKSAIFWTAASAKEILNYGFGFKQRYVTKTKLKR